MAITLTAQPKTPRSSKAPRWIVLLTALLFLVSSFMAGFVIGHSNENRTVQGATIFLSPTTSAAVPINVYGRVVRDDGSACPAIQVEWRSEPRYTTTNEKGNFFFDNVELGLHTVRIYNDDGAIVGKSEVDISRDIMLEGLQLKKSTANGQYQLTLSAQVIDVDLMAVIHADDGSMELIADPSYSGINIQGGAMADESQSGGRTAYGGGLFGGEVFQRFGNGKNESGGADKTEPPQQPAAPGFDAAQPPEEQPAQPTPEEQPAQPTPEQPPEEQPVTPPEPPIVIPPIDGDKGDGGGNRDVVITSQEDGEQKVWSNGTQINLFGNGIKLQPGSSGGYAFKVKNPNQFAVRFQLWMVDNAMTNPDDMSVPLQYRLKYGEEYVVGDETTWFSGTDIKANWVQLKASESCEYTLEWIWPYESGDQADRVDTHLGKTHDQPHVIQLWTYFEQI